MVENTLIGLVSWGSTLYYCTSQETPGVFVRITKYLSWIKKNTRGSNICVN